MLTRLLLALAVLCAAAPARAGHAGDPPTSDLPSGRVGGATRVIVQARDGQSLETLFELVGARRVRSLRAVGADVVEVDDAALPTLAGDPRVRAVSVDRPVASTMERAAAAVGARWVRESLGFDGAGVGVALVDSGVTAWHDDLAGHAGQRVVHFVDFVNRRPNAYDDFGHGTHVAGIVAGNGFTSDGARAGIAPGASLVALKVLDESGDGYVSDVIAAIDYAIEHRDEFNVRVMNLSVAAAPTESYHTDPLTLAARRATEAGIVVVCASGNMGRTAAGESIYGGITAPGNAPWVLTVGAATHNGTVEREDDTVASFSSRGPTRFDNAAKPDIVAPGVGIESLSQPGSALYRARPQMRLWGTVETADPPYFSMSGTSMAAPVVAGTVALMVQANPSLTPNAIKAILQYTAEPRKDLDLLTQGAGFLNARGAVQLAAWFGTPDAPVDEDTTTWSRRIHWGNHRVSGGVIMPDASAWAASTIWGAAFDANGDNIVWGTMAGSEGLLWGTACATERCESIAWGAPGDDNFVWGTSDDQEIVWGARRR